MIHAELALPTSADGLRLTIYNCDEATFEKLALQLTRRGRRGTTCDKPCEWVSFVGEITMFKA
jgi:hypothetical protein